MLTQDFFYYDDGVVHGSLLGDIGSGSWADFFCKTLALAGINRTRDLLIDLREAHLRPNALNVHRLPMALEYISQSRFYRMVVVVERSAPEYSSFEEVFLNHGSRLQLFTEYRQAEAWLRRSDSRADVSATRYDDADLNPDGTGCDGFPRELGHSVENPAA